MVSSEQKGNVPLDEQALFKQAKQAEVEQAHRKQILDERLKLQDQLERGELSDLLKEKLVKEHDETITFLEKALQHSLERLDMKIERELLIKKKLEESSNPDLDTRHRNPNLQNSDQKILTLLVDNISIFQKADQIAAARTTLLVHCMYTSIFPADENTSKLQESSLLLTLLKEVDNQLKANVQSTKLTGVKNDSDENSLPKNAFRDIEDLQVNCEGDLSPVHPEDLSGREFVIYQYGIYILQLLKSHFNIGDLSLQMASSLPNNNYHGNAFTQSFLYLRAENKLFVPRKYLQSVGSFTLLLVHCISHILSDGFEDDSNPFFLRTFYQAIKVCFNECFFTRHELSFLSQSNIASSTNDGILTKAEDCYKKIENQNVIPEFISMKFTPSNKHVCYKERTDEMLSVCEVEAILKEKLAKKKREFFDDSFRKISCEITNQENSQDGMTMEQLHGALDQLNTELTAILEKEVESQKNQNNSEGQSFYLKALFFEKECLIKKIDNLEKQITYLSNIM
ncbi:uncharacterized protein LOC120915130 [Rana temporaria]|uniref:uncharacterized protein LOC120915130 n=1 Tax=Rana temporaria TaxID=8407 RepID=UPI001AADDDC2|nr:uncharacterized protein LOC120915130 [Rana temporaria]